VELAASRGERHIGGEPPTRQSKDASVQ
jgi:hypothetical protein